MDAKYKDPQYKKNLIELARCKKRLSDLDYIGIKIATGRATVEEYADEIAEMRKLASEVEHLTQELEEIKNNK